jgi:hypothetical protein
MRKNCTCKNCTCRESCVKKLSYVNFFGKLCVNVMHIIKYVLKNYHPIVMLEKYHLIVMWKKLYIYISYTFLTIVRGGERNFPEKENHMLFKIERS